MLFIIDNKQRRFMDINALWLKETLLDIMPNVVDVGYDIIIDT